MSDYTGPELCALSACDAVALLKAGEVSPAEMIDASLSRIAQTDPDVNALPTICEDRARDHAARSDVRATVLKGLPLAIKDLSNVAGVRTTCGTAGMAEFVAETSDPLVIRLEDRGGTVLAKSNTPEMGAGANTFNAVFGATRNPWDTALNAGGSSGGAAAALATGQVWLAHGSDLGGSLRTPAAYCGVVGLRPSPGMVPGASGAAFQIEGVQGPMARNVADCALFFDAMVGFDAAHPTSFPAPDVPFVETTRQDPGKVRIAYSATMNGLAPVEPEMDQTLRDALTGLADNDIDVAEACPDLPELDRTYRTLRAMAWAVGPGRAPQSIQRHFKATLAENIALGHTFGTEDIYDAQIARSTIYANMHGFLTHYDVLATPVVGLLPQPVEIEYPTAVNGQPMRDYIDWLAFTFLSTTAGLPSMSLPVGFCRGLPVGLQLIGRPRGEARLLQIAARIEGKLNLTLGPIDPIAHSP